jgi:hypothetical protein
MRMKAASVDSIKHITKTLSLYGPTTGDIEADLKILEPHQRKKLLREAETIALNHVYGPGFKRDKNGVPQEQGLGSAAQPTSQSVAAYEKYCKHETNYVEHLAKMKADLAAYEARKAKEEAEAEAAEDEDTDE